ncbi:scavenger receptor class B member 1 [Culicoides brevitarsis]|uniref:scavenger receptor class B member 1 n=1 Tax=Culicoides brevitarsis TaxID=469753 RepID=UPI00307B3906
MSFYDPYDLIFKWKLQYGEDGEIFDLWRKPPADIYTKIYLFNITNADEFMAGKEKLKLKEVGPYVYKELFTHDNVTFNNNGTVSTTPRHPLVWQPHLSEGFSEDDIFMLPNIALLSIAQVVADKSYFVRLPINLVIRQAKERPIVKMTAREFMFGYETTLTTLGNNILPNWIKFDKVGLIDRMYDFSGDFETFFSGTTNPQISGLYDTYRGSTNLNHWNGEECSNIQYASDGVKFKSFVQPNETLLFFRKSMCRAQTLVPTGSTSVIGNLAASKYKFEKNALDNGEINEKNKCFCQNGQCLPRGLIDVNHCYYGFPIALSYPHFLDADEKLLNMTEGLFPDLKKHDSYFMINRQSGLPLDISVKFQINMAMHDVGNMANVDRFSHLVIPMLWFEISMPGLPQDLQNRFVFYLNILPWIVKFSHWGCYILGALLILFATFKASLKLNHNLKRAHNVHHAISFANGGNIYLTSETTANRDSEMQSIIEEDNYEKFDQTPERKTSLKSCLTIDHNLDDTNYSTELKITEDEPVPLWYKVGEPH